MLGRRSIQKLLHNSHQYLTPPQIDALVHRLNKGNLQVIDSEWELIVLAALSQIGEVEHEPALGGSARLDVRFGSQQIAFVADITTVSDEGYNRDNPIQALAEEFIKISHKLREEGIAGNLGFRVNGAGPNSRGGEYRTKLLMPRKHEFRQFIFDEHFETFLAAVRLEPEKVRHHLVNNDRASVSIVFSPSSMGTLTFSNPPYNVAHDVMHNVVYGALEKKAKQIKKAGKKFPNELAGIFLCDGGCGILREPSGIGTIGLNQIVLSFLRTSGTVDFVGVIDVASGGWPLPYPHFMARVWSLRATSCHVFEDILNLSLKELPQPVLNGRQTLTCLKWEAADPSRKYKCYKGRSMSIDSIELSSRAALDYLSGRIDKTEFERVVPVDWLIHLKRRLDAGDRIAKVSLASYDDEDDDGLVFTFSGQDAAISPYQSLKDSSE